MTLLVLFYSVYLSAYSNEPTPTYRKKDIEFENRVVESMKRAPLDPSYDLESGKNHPDLHKKRLTYSNEIDEALKEWKR